MIVSRELVSCSELLKRLPHLFTDSIGDVERGFTAVAAPNTRDENSAIFIVTPKALKEGLASAAKVLIINKKFRAAAEAHPAKEQRTILFAHNADYAMSMTIREFFLGTPYVNRQIDGIHPTATVASDAVIANGVRIGPHAFVGARVTLAKNVFIGANSVIEDDTTIDENSVIHPLVFIGHSTRIGKACEIHPNTTVGKEGFGYAHDEKGNHYRVPHLGSVIIEDDVHLGSSCTVDRGTFENTEIRFGAKIDNRVHIGHNCVVGKNSIITAGLLMAGSAKVGANFLTGGGSVISGHLEICDNVQLAALTAVSKGISTPGSYGGNPILPLQAHLKRRAALGHVHEMRKQISFIMKHLGLKTNEPNSED